MSFTSPTFTTVSLGTERNAISVQLLEFPKFDAPLLDKVQAFAYFEEILRQYRPQLSSVSVQLAYANNVPVSSSAAASEEANRIGCELYSSLFHVDNLSCLGFYDSSGSKVDITTDPSTRVNDIAFVNLEATIDPVAFSPDLHTIPPFVVPYYLKLPQSTDAAATPSTPTHQISATAAKTAADNAAALALLSSALASGASIASLNLADASVTQALAALLSGAAGQPPSTPTSTARRLNYADGSASAPPPPSPSVRRHLANATGQSQTFRGALDFLDCQSFFDTLFPSTNRTPIGSLFSQSTASTVKSIDTITDSIQDFLDLCRLTIFQSVIRLDYIGLHEFTSSDHLQTTVKRIRALRLDFHAKGKSIKGNPDMLYSKYLALIPLLPASHVNIWGLNLFSQFWEALGEDLTRRVSKLPRYLAIYKSTFDLTQMTTKASQMTALRELRSMAVECFSTLQDDRASMRDMLRDLAPSGYALSRQNASNHNTDVVTPSVNASAAEETMQRYSNPNRQTSQTNHTGHAGGGNYDGCEFPPDFRGCLGCGGDHIFKQCPHRSERASVDRFHRNYNARKALRNSRQHTSGPAYSGDRSPGNRYGPSSFDVPPGNPPQHGAGRGADRNLPAWLSQQNHSRKSEDRLVHFEDDQQDEPAPKKHKTTRNFTLQVKCYQHDVTSARPLRPMPLRVDNGLPHITLHLGTPTDDESIGLCALFDSGAALSSGYLPYHLWVMRECPDLVASFERFDDSNPFEPIKLGGAIRNPADYNESTHGQLTAVIRYHTPYCDNDSNPITISFGLGNDMTVNTILGMPLIKDLGMTPDFRAGTVACTDSPATFDLEYKETTCGVPPADTTASAFIALPLDEMYPAPSTPRVNDCAPSPPIAATDDISQGFLQRTLT
jgi:hypothetical protein